MTRPTLTTIEHGQESWDVDINDNNDVLVNGPFPVHEEANEAAILALDPTLYDRCLVAAADTGKLYISNGVSWDVFTSGAILISQLPIEVQNNLETGLTSGGELTINGGDNTKFDLAAGQGLIVDNHTDPTNPVVTLVTWPQMLAQTPTGLGSSLRSYVAIDTGGSIVQQTFAFTETQKRDLIILGNCAHTTGAQIDATASGPVVAFNKTLEAHDFMSVIGPMNKSGNVYSANGANLNIDKSSGSAFRLGARYDSSKKTPSITSDGALSPAVFFYTYQDGIGGFTIGTPGIAIDPNNYDNGSGVLAAVPALMWTVQRIFFFAGSTFTGVHYGQSVHATKADALAAIDQSIVINPEAQFAVFRSWLVVQQGATDLSNTAQAEFVQAGRLGLIDVSGGGAGGEVNTATNEGAAGVGPFHQKTGVNLEFRNVAPGADAVITPTLNAGSKTIELPVRDATETLDGVIEIATQGEADAAVDDVRAITPLKLGNWSRSPTAGEKAALVGTFGAPGAGNKYVTQTDPALGAGSRTPKQDTWGWATQQSTTAAYVTPPGGRFPFLGSTLLGASPIRFRVVGGIVGATTAAFRIQDITNALTIAEVTGVATAAPAVIDLGAISNIPAGPAVFAVQFQRDGGGGGGDRAQISGVVIGY